MDSAYNSRMDLNVTLTERERQMVIDALICWDGEGCYNSSVGMINDVEIGAILAKLKADPDDQARLATKSTAAADPPDPNGT